MPMDGQSGYPASPCLDLGEMVGDPPNRLVGTCSM
jgi:hypothetical protein